jgi:hypothetical protein
MHTDFRRGKLRDSNGRTSYQFLVELFAYENCEECGKGARGHDAVPLMGNWFARCKSCDTREDAR